MRIKSVKSYPEDGDAADDGGVLGRGQGVVGGGEDALGSARAVAGGLDVDLFWGHHLWLRFFFSSGRLVGCPLSVVRCGGW